MQGKCVSVVHFEKLLAASTVPLTAAALGAVFEFGFPRDPSGAAHLPSGTVLTPF